MPEITIKSLEKAIDFLFLFTPDKPLLSLPEIACTLKIPESTAYRLLVTFRKKRLVTQDPQTKKYGLDARLLRLQMAASARLDISRMARSHLEKLSTLSGETSKLYLLQGDEVVCTEVVGSRNAIAYMPDRGRSYPLHAPAGGRAILAFLPDSFLSDYIRRGLRSLTPWTVTNAEELTSELSKVQQEGFAISFQQTSADARGAFAPVFDHGGAAIASLGVVGPDNRFTDERARALGPVIVKEAQALSTALGAPFS